MSRLALGIDGGGTKTAAVCLDVDVEGMPRVGAIGHAGPGNIANVPLSSIVAHIQEAVAAMTAPVGQIAAVCAGVAGASYGERREQLAAALERMFPGAKIDVVPDFAVAFTGALGGAPGAVVIAGTGSVAYGENAKGQIHRAGGYGYLIDDSGNGYGVGRRAIAAVLRAADGTEQKTTLTERLAKELGSVAWEDLIAGVYGREKSSRLDPAGIAGLAPIVALAAEKDNDPAAQSILMHAGGALARLAEAVALRLFAPDERFSLATIGSLWECGPYLTDVFSRSLARFAPAAERIGAKHDPATGAALRAAAQLR